MASRPLIIASLLGASIGVPYVASQSTSGSSQPGGAQPAAMPTAPTTSPVGATFSGASAAPANPASAPLPVQTAVLEGPRFQSVEQFLRFDLTKEWVYRHWERKSTGPTDVGLFSVRVPLVMGTQPTSLAGSLTYYFNSQNQIEHISFQGTTADTRQLVNFLVRTYEFQRVESPVGEQVYQVARRGRVQSELRTGTKAVLDSKSPLNSVAVHLELARPGTRRFLPPRDLQLPIPPAAASPIASAGEGAADSANPMNSYLDKLRYATPQEQDQVLWKRWPN